MPWLRDSDSEAEGCELITVVDNVTNLGRKNGEEGEGGGSLYIWLGERSGCFILWLCLAALLFPQDVCAILVPARLKQASVWQEGYLSGSGLERWMT